MSHNNQKKIALINDMSGFGRCSIAVALPIISVMKVQCCALPTSIFSNHTGFENYFMEDFTEQMIPYIENWEKLDLRFNGICTGFLGSEKQIQIVSDFIRTFKKKETLVLVDPVMGDYGKPYSTYTPKMCQRMKELVKYADILTPNITEACILTDTPYKEKWKIKEIEEMAEKLSEQGPSRIVITGIPQKSYVANLCYEVNHAPSVIKVHRVGTERSGTGDIFASIVAADAVNGVNFQLSVKKASRFIKKCILRSMELDIPTTDGVCFEELLGSLR
ncbi:MAG: pyridoxamine kinase [Lachnospiraceae bacterium]|nr:pyridoxamine kinase [Lachnospiraceae bacterium]